VTYRPFDIVIVPFPFTDTNETKKRPAIVLSSERNFSNQVGHSVMAMITSARNEPWALDTSITNLQAAGLPKPSIIRMKLFTLDHRFIIKKIGQLNIKDQNNLRKSLKSVFSDFFNRHL